MYDDPLSVHLYGGPGTGKSTTRALVFGTLKQLGRDVEEVPEYAKELTWEQAFHKLSYQPLVAAEQMWRMDRIGNQVEAIITDTSTLFSFIYGLDNPSNTPAFRKWLLDDYKSRNCLNIFLDRDPNRAYNPNGRNQTEQEAMKIDNDIQDLLLYTGLDFTTIRVDKELDSHVDRIVRLILDRLDERKDAETSKS